MPGLELASVSLRHADTGINIVIFDVDPQSYDPFIAPVRGSVIPTLDGGAVRQVFGLKTRDFRLELSGFMTDYDTVQAVWNLYRQSASGVELEWRDWFPNRFKVIFTPGTDSFHPVPVPGACELHSYTMSLIVCEVLEWFGGSY